MATWREVASLNEAHPDWTAQMIAVELECDPAYIRATGRRKKLKFAKARYGFSVDLEFIRREVRAAVDDLGELDRALVKGESINGMRRRIAEVRALLDQAAKPRERFN